MTLSTHTNRHYACQNNTTVATLEILVEAIDDLRPSYNALESSPYTSNDNSVTFPSLAASSTRPRSSFVGTGYNPMSPILRTCAVELKSDATAYTVEP